MEDRINVKVRPVSTESHRFLKAKSTSGITYRKELKTGDIKSINACILLQYLENCFAKNGDGFEMYISPAKENGNRRSAAANLEDELGMSLHELKSAFAELGVSYSSRDAWRAAKASGDIFNGKLYCRYFQRSAVKNNTTKFFRNHAAVEELIHELD